MTDQKKEDAGKVAVVPNAELLDDPKMTRLTLGGIDWPLPMLAPKQQRTVIPGIMKVAPRFMFSDDGTVNDRVRIQQILVGLDTETIDLLNECIYVALTRAHPTLPRAQYDNMEVGLFDMCAAIGPLSHATGMLKKINAEEENKLGEEAAGSQ